MDFSIGVKMMLFSEATGYFGGAREGMVDFSLGEPKDSPPESAAKAYSDAARQGCNRYAPVQGLPELRERIAEKLRRQNRIDAAPDEVMVTNGATEAIAFSIMSLIGRGDEAIVIEPSYPIIAPMVSFCGGKPVSLLLEEKDGFRPDLERLKSMIGRRTRLLAINTPHNPTGSVFGEGCLRAISEIYGGPILVDEVYENYTYDARHCSLASMADKPENVITVNSFSKTYCMCGYRVGYLHATQELVKQMLKLKLCMSTCTGNPSQRAAMAAMDDAGFPALMKRSFEGRRQLLVRGLKRLGLQFAEPEGAFYLFPNVSELGSDTEASMLFMKAGVLTMPGTIFHGSCRENVRFSFVADASEITEGLSRLEGILA